MTATHEQIAAEQGEFRSYYGRPILQEPTWKTPDVPAYLFLGGLAGSSATLAALADRTRRPGMSTIGTVAAAGASLASVGALIHDLGRPTRFLNMLRVFKPTSPLSVGTWILSPFSALASGAAASAVTGRLPQLGRLAQLGAGTLGPPMCTYTAVLLADTAVPAWHGPYRELPVLFGGSAVASGSGLALLAAPHREHAPARRLAVLGAAAELTAEKVIERRHGLEAEPYSTGHAGRWMRAGTVLTAAGAGLTLLARRSRLAAAAAGTAYLAGGLATRFGVFEAGRQSARDPKYTVVPQRQRVREQSTSRA